MQTRSRFPASARCWLIPAVLTLAALVGCASTSAPSAESKAPAPSTVPANPIPAASGELDHSQQFARWVAQFSNFARQAGIDEATLNIAFDGVRFVPRVIESDRAQPEFTRAVWDYLDSALSSQRVARGQGQLLGLQPEVGSIVARYGVPAEVLIAIWGLESNYGSFVGNIPTIDALATLGFEGRREAWARAELLAALKILQNRDIERAQMIGSWAGAMGQTQFLPSNYLAYAVDADGDGRRDIWGSLADVMASTANFLAKSGWQAGQPWGLEVRLPSGFDYARADDGMRLPASVWMQAGIQTMDGAQLPELTESSVLLPAGASGPAFLIGPNFRAILRYNNSSSYALAVGLLSQRLAGRPAVQAPWPSDFKLLSRSELLDLQTALNARGIDCGTPDGMMGPLTRRCVRGYQLSLDLPADGFPTLELLKRLR